MDAQHPSEGDSSKSERAVEAPVDPLPKGPGFEDSETQPTHSKEDAPNANGRKNSGRSFLRQLLFPSGSPLPDFANQAGVHNSARLHRDFRRKEHLNSLIRGTIAPIVVVSGASGSGKSYIIQLLGEHGVKQAERLITRGRRPSDPKSDVQWTQGNRRASPDNLLFSYNKYESHYGFPKDSLIKDVRRGNAVALIAGDVGKLLPLNDALDYHIPFAPVVNLRIDVPLQIAEKRLLELREEGEDGEGALRAQNNKRILEWEDGQLAVLKDSLRVVSWFNFTKEEYESHRLSNKQIRPLDSELVGQLYQDLVETEKARSAYYASLCLQPAATIAPCEDFPPGLFEVLTEKLLPAMASEHAVPLIKGGLAAQIYLSANLEDQPKAPELEGAFAFERTFQPRSKPTRPVSPDIDWTFLCTPSEQNIHRTALQRITGKREEFATDTEKPVFHSRKINSSTMSPDGENEIELDAISVSRINPPGLPFTFEFLVDDYLEFQRRKVSIAGSGQSASLVPPEMLVMEKLCAGRGEELGKLDVYDATALMLSQAINPRTINHIIFSQRYDAERDKELDPTLLEQPDLPDIDQVLRKIGIQNNQLRQTITNRMLNFYEAERHEEVDVGEQAGDLSALRFLWKPDNLKQAAFLDRILSTIDKAEDTERTALENEEETTLQKVFPAEAVLEALGSMREYLMHLAKYYVGREDLFLERTFKPEWIG